MHATIGGGWLLGLSLLCSAATSAPADPCEHPDPYDEQVTMTLVRSFSKDLGFLGVFDLKNRTSREVSIPGRVDKGNFVVGEPEVVVEFRDLNSSWQPFVTPPGSFLPRPSHLTIRPLNTVQATVFLMTHEVANLGGSNFRVLIRLVDPNLCIVSQEFKATPKRSTVDGFETIPNSLKRPRR
jgi:hypothetical protein